MKWLEYAETQIEMMFKKPCQPIEGHSLKKEVYVTLDMAWERIEY